MSNFSYDIVKEVAARGYSTALYYIGATNVSVLNTRIQTRVALGFHYVSPEDVESRYKEARQKLPSNLKLFDKVVLLDNSVQGATPSEVLQLERGIIKWEAAVIPKWLEQMLTSIRGLSHAYQTLESRTKKGPDISR